MPALAEHYPVVLFDRRGHGRSEATPEHMLEIHRLIGGSRLCIVPNCDHFVFARKTALFDALALEFLAGR